MPFQDNTIDISELQKADLTVGEVRDLILVLESVSAGLILPEPAATALQRLMEGRIAKKGITS
jgi:hypothetical protein